MLYELIKLNTARNCLRYVVRAFQIKEIFLPYYVCPTLRNAVFKENCKINYYHVNLNFFPTEKFPSDAFIVYPNYFGICSKNVEILSAEYKNLIVDNAHSFFSKPAGIASFNSVRKFFPEIENGAFLYTTKKCEQQFISDDYFYELKEKDFPEFVKNEKRLDFEDIKYMSECSLKYLSFVDFEEEAKKRKAEFQNYHNEYKNMNLLKIDISENDVPFKYPLLTKSTQTADIIVKKFEKCGKIIFRYWNNLPESYEEKLFYTNLICL